MSKNRFLVVLAVIFALAFGAAILSSCAARSAAPPYAVEITGPGGVRCFAVMSGDQVAGGGCVKE